MASAGHVGKASRRRILYLLGYPLQIFSPNRLPTGGEVFLRIYWINQSHATAIKTLSSKIECPLESTGKLKCRGGMCYADCRNEITNVCIIRELINIWNKAALMKILSSVNDRLSKLLNILEQFSLVKISHKN